MMLLEQSIKGILAFKATYNIRTAVCTTDFTITSGTSRKDNERRPGFGVQEWDDGSIYEGEFMNGLKHGKGKYTWKTGEYYEGFFYKDYCHGEGFYCWPSGHKFTGKFHFNRKEGYGHHLFPDGTSFQGLYRLDQRFGPGVMTYPNGCMDVGLWVGKHLHKLCDVAEESFSLEDFPEYAAYVEPRAPVQLLDDVACSLLLTGQSREMDQVSLGERGEADACEGERDPASSLTLQARMEAHMHKHRLAAVNWDVGAVLALNRDPFSAKGPLEVMSEQLIQCASRGELQAVSKIIQTGLVHPDVADSRGNTALIVATVNYHHDVLHLLLDVGADIDKLNGEGMTALAVCHLLYYPFLCLPAVFTPPPARTQVLESLCTHGGSPDTSQVDPSERDPVLSSQRTSRDISAHTFDDLNGPKNPLDTRQLQEEEKDLKETENSSTQNMGWTKGAKEREIDSSSAQALEIREREVKQEGIECKEGQRVVQESRKEKREVYLKTLKLLLKRGADPNTSRIPVPVLFSAILACDREGIKRLLLLGARTDIPLPPEKRGLYPLHVAAALPGPAGPEITEMLLHTCQDPDARAHDHDETFELDKVFVKAHQSPNESSHLKEGGRTALHVACQRYSDHQNAAKVVALLLSHQASTDLLWSGHSPLSLAIATGNTLAVEELLNGGANPNLPLGAGVGSALCAFANIHYTSDDRKEKLLQLLVEAGADILMPVMVDGDVGTAMDYAYYSFHQDLRISGTPFNAMSTQEQQIFKARCRLLCMMGDLMRQAAHRRELENLAQKEQRRTGTETDSSPQQQPQASRKPVPKFCYYCGRSVLVRLTPCYRCYKVFYCSRPCRLKAWDELHKNECVRVKAGARSLAVGLSESSDGQEPSTMTNITEEMWRMRHNPRENYTFN